MYVKVCGLDTPEHAIVAIDAGADAIGVVMHAGSSRTRTLDEARAIVDAVRAHGAGTTVVFVTGNLDALEAARNAAELGVDVLQLHGAAYGAAEFAAAQELVPRLWRATSLADDPDLHVGALGEEAILLDAPRPGSGEQWDVAALAERRPDGDWLLAGGLTPDNIEAAIVDARPWGVDVSSGVESAPGVKDPERIRAFVAAARRAAARLG